MKIFRAFTTALLALALPSAAAPLFTPSTPTYGGIVSGGNFVTGGSTTVFSPPSNGWPSVQGPTKAVDGLIGPGSKYLNLNVTDTALIFSGTTARVPARLELWVAEDAVERDPATYTLYGTNASIPALTSGATFALGNFTEIASGTLALPDPRDTTADGVGYSQSVPIPGSTAYASYLLVFPTVKNAPAAADAMQISEVQLHADGINAVESSDFSNVGPGPSFFLEPGVNRISGTLLTPDDGQDRFSVIVPSGTRLVSVSDNNAFNNGSSTFPLPAGTYPVLFSVNFAPAPAPWFFNLTVESVPSTLPIIGVESFDYPDGPIAAKNGGTFWDYKNFSPTAHTGTASTWDNVAAAPTIASGRLVTHNSSAKRAYNGASEADGAVNDPASVPGSVAKSVYFRVTVTTGATVPDSFGLSSYDFGTEKLFFGKRGGQARLGIDETGVSGTDSTNTPDLQPNTTYTLVAMVDYAANIVRLYLNPDLNAPESTQPPAVTRAYAGTNWSTAVRLASSGGSPVVWDNLVVATAWDVLGTVVTTTVDEDNLSLSGGGNGVSLREAVKYAPAGGLITFAPNLSRQTVTLTHADGDMEIPQAVTIDATALPGGLKLNGNNTSRHFYLDTGKSLTLRGLTLTGGNAAGLNSNFGGAIFSRGTLTLTQCNLSGNVASQSGGAITNSGGTLSLTQCTLFGNAASSSGGSGGAILNQLGTATATLTQCTLSGNSARFGGVISNTGTLTLTHCTITGNSAITQGGAIDTNGTLTLTNSIVAGNSLTSAGSGADINNYSTVTRVGTNLVQSLVNNGGSSNVTGTGTIINAGPKLSPLGYFGGPVQTMHPLIGSPAIDAIVTSDPGGTDARGFPRFVDGSDTLSGAQLDIGAVEAGITLPVTLATDFGGSGTLRTRLANAAIFSEPGVRIVFDPAVFPAATITLNGNQLTPPDGKAIFIDASNLSAPVTVSGGGNSRVFNIPATATVAMHSVRIMGGNAASDAGGGILNEGTCTLMSSTLSANTASTGGGIYSDGSFSGNAALSLTQCTISGNQASTSGGGIVNSGTEGRATLNLTSCTVSGNSAGYDGGGLYNQVASLNLSACTVSGNTAVFYGGGIYSITDSASGPRATLGLHNTIVAGNSDGQGFPNLQSQNSDTTQTGANLTSGDPLLAPLGDYGGPTQTMALRPGSPARNAATGSTRTTDQRGFPMVGAPDIGAYEAGNALPTHYDAFIWETLPDTATESQTARAFDFDGDGQSNEAEFTSGTSPADSASVFRVAGITNSGGSMTFSFPSVDGKTYTLWRSDTLANDWVNTGLPAITGDGLIREFEIPAPAPGVPKRFFSVNVEP